MSLDNPKPSIGSTSEFQASAWPWVTSSVSPAAGSPVRLAFPMVSKYITVTNLSTTSTDTLSFGFTPNGVKLSSNKFILRSNQTITLEVKTAAVYLQGESGTPAYNLFAGLTGVQPTDMPPLSSSLSGSVVFWPGVG